MSQGTQQATEGGLRFINGHAVIWVLGTESGTVNIPGHFECSKCDVAQKDLDEFRKVRCPKAERPVGKMFIAE